MTDRDASLGIAENAAFAIMMAIAAYLGRENPDFAYPQILWSFLALLSFNLASFLAARSGRMPPRPRARAAVLGNALLIAVVVHYSGGRESHFWVMDLLPLFSACLTLERGDVLAAFAVVSALLVLPYLSAVRDVLWAELLELSVKLLTLAAAGGMTWRVASAERGARGRLEEEHERARRERQDVREKLQSMDRLAALGTLSAGMAHELNGPLASILGYAEALTSDGAVDESTAKALGRIEFSAKLCRDIIRNTLAFARERGVERAPADLNALVRQCVDLKRHDWLGGAVRVEEDYAPEPERVVVSAPEIQQIVFNLLTNAEQAIRAARPAGVIRVRTAIGAGRARVEIEDDGPGVPDAALGKIWEPFFTTKPVGQGTGLGLSISRDIAKKHGGELMVESRPGRTVFTLELPAPPSA